MKRQNLDQIKNNLEAILSPESIVGGSIILSTADLQVMFDFSALGGINSQASINFISEVTKLASTDVGGGMLSGLLFSATRFHTKITLSNDSPDAGAAADYNSGTNTIRLGNITNFDLTNKGVDAKVFGAISHELYHAYQKNFEHVADLNGNVPTSEIRHELEAYLFQGMVEKQYDILHPTSFSYVLDMGIVINKSITQSQPGFVSAWNTIMSGQDFNVDQYNTMVTEMKETWFDNYMSEMVSTVDGINGGVYTNALFNLYQSNYGTVAPVPIQPSSTPSGSGSGGGSNDPANIMYAPVQSLGDGVIPFYYGSNVIITGPSSGGSGSGGSGGSGSGSGTNTSGGVQMYLHIDPDGVPNYLFVPENSPLPDTTYWTLVSQ